MNEMKEYQDKRIRMCLQKLKEVFRESGGEIIISKRRKKIEFL